MTLWYERSPAVHAIHPPASFGIFPPSCPAQTRLCAERGQKKIHVADPIPRHGAIGRLRPGPDEPPRHHRRRRPDRRGGQHQPGPLLQRAP